jgi:hypothetical protein
VRRPLRVVGGDAKPITRTGATWLAGMTPLAAYLLRQTLVRLKHREGIWRDPDKVKLLREFLSDIHCFEVTAIKPLATELQGSLKARGEKAAASLFEKFSFLPAPNTWMEWRWKERRIGVLCEEREHQGQGKPYIIKDDEGTPEPDLFTEDHVGRLGAIYVNTDQLAWTTKPSLPRWLRLHAPAHVAPERIVKDILAFVRMCLVVINSPKIIGRQTFMPNRALERDATKEFGPGKFPLHAWTEIKLRVAKPAEIDDGEAHEAHLTGQRALHFVRKFVRIRLGRLEYVSAHWRGDPAIGIKQSRYTVEP